MEAVVPKSIRREGKASVSWRAKLREQVRLFKSGGIKGKTVKLVAKEEELSTPMKHLHRQGKIILLSPGSTTKKHATSSASMFGASVSSTAGSVASSSHDDGSRSCARSKSQVNVQEFSSDRSTTERAHKSIRSPAESDKEPKPAAVSKVRERVKVSSFSLSTESTEGIHEEHELPVFVHGEPVGVSAEADATRATKKHGKKRPTAPGRAEADLSRDSKNAAQNDPMLEDRYYTFLHPSIPPPSHASSLLSSLPLLPPLPPPLLPPPCTSPSSPPSSAPPSLLPPLPPLPSSLLSSCPYP